MDDNRFELRDGIVSVKSGRPERYRLIARHPVSGEEVQAVCDNDSVLKAVKTLPNDDHRKEVLKYSDGLEALYIFARRFLDATGYELVRLETFSA